MENKNTYWTSVIKKIFYLVLIVAIVLILLADVIDLGIQHGEDLIVALLIAGVEPDDLVLVVILLLTELRQAAEHGAVAHMMAVDQRGAAVGGTVAVHEEHAALGIIAVEIHMEVGIVIAGSVHDGIVDHGVLDLQPAEEIGVALIQLIVLPQGAGLLVDRVVLFIDQLGDLAEGLRLMLGGDSRLGRHDRAEDEAADQNDQKEDDDDPAGLFLGFFRFLDVSQSDYSFVNL